MDTAEITFKSQNLSLKMHQKQQISIKRPAGHHQPLTSHLTLVSRLTSSEFSFFICKVRVNVDVVEGVLDCGWACPQLCQVPV